MKFNTLLASLSPSPYAATLKADLFETPLGTLVGIADERDLYLLHFIDDPEIESVIARLCHTIKAVPIKGENAPLTSIRTEMEAYFQGCLKKFKTPIALVGTDFQKKVWERLKEVPFGSTLSYSGLAAAIGKPTAFRAAAQANAVNKLAIIIPCHRIINASGALGGFNWGLDRKEWLLSHEKISAK